MRHRAQYAMAFSPTPALRRRRRNLPRVEHQIEASIPKARQICHVPLDVDREPVAFGPPWRPSDCCSGERSKLTTLAPALAPVPVGHHPGNCTRLPLRSPNRTRNRQARCQEHLPFPLPRLLATMEESTGYAVAARCRFPYKSVVFQIVHRHSCRGHASARPLHVLLIGCHWILCLRSV